jgi:O-antigen/teichoic acid export membrane protein
LLLQSSDTLVPNLDASVVIALSFGFIFSSYGSVATTVLQAKGEYKLASDINVIATIFSVFVSLIVILFYQSVFVLVAKELTYRIILMIFSVYKAGGIALIKPHFRMKRSTMNLLLFQSYRVWGINVLDITSARIDKFLTNIYYAPVVLSNLHQAKYFSELPSTLLGPLRPLMLEKLTDHNYTNEDKDNLVNKITIMLLSLGCVCGIALYFYGQNIIYFILGEEWLIAARLAQGLSFYIAILPYANFIKIAAYYKKQNRQVVLAQFVQLFAFIILFIYISTFHTIHQLPLVFFISTLLFVVSLLFFIRKAS